MVKRRKAVLDRWKQGTPVTTKPFTSSDTHRVWSVQLDGSRMVTGSTSCSLQVWDLAKARPVKTLRGHTSEVRCHQFVDNRLVSGGYGIPSSYCSPPHPHSCGRLSSFPYPSRPLLSHG